MGLVYQSWFPPWHHDPDAKSGRRAFHQRTDSSSSQALRLPRLGESPEGTRVTAVELRAGRPTTADGGSFAAQGTEHRRDFAVNASPLCPAGLRCRQRIEAHEALAWVRSVGGI